MPKSTMTQKERYFKKLEEQQQAAAAAAAAEPPAEPPRTSGSARSNDTETKTSGVFVNQGVYHPSLGVIALSYGVDAGYIARKTLKFNSSNGELSEGQQALAAKQAISQAYTDMVQSLALDMLKNGTRDLDITPENIGELTDNPVVINLFTKCQLGITLVNTNVDKDDSNVEVNQENLANLFA